MLEPLLSEANRKDDGRELTGEQIWGDNAPAGGVRDSDVAATGITK